MRVHTNGGEGDRWNFELSGVDMFSGDGGVLWTGDHGEADPGNHRDVSQGGHCDWCRSLWAKQNFSSRTRQLKKLENRNLVRRGDSEQHVV